MYVCNVLKDCIGISECIEEDCIGLSECIEWDCIGVYECIEWNEGTYLD